MARIEVTENRLVKDLSVDGKEYTLLQGDDVIYMYEYLGLDLDDFGYNYFLVVINNGDFDEIWGIKDSMPFDTSVAYKIELIIKD